MTTKNTNTKSTIASNIKTFQLLKTDDLNDTIF